MTEDIFSQWLNSLDFEFWSTGQHKIAPTIFFEKWAKGDAILLDVRAAQEKDFVTLPFALAIPIDELPQRLNEIPRDKLVATFCSGGDRAGVAFVAAAAVFGLLATAAGDLDLVDFLEAEAFSAVIRALLK